MWNEQPKDSFEYYLALKAQKNRLPYNGTFELSPICNMKCKMCYIEKKKRDVLENGGLLDVDFWYKTIKSAYDEGMLFALLTGGEPFLYDGFEELYEKIVQLPIYISINTNATLLTEDKIKWLSKFPPRRLNISLYGASNETYKALCQNPKGFDQVSNSILLLKKYGISCRIHTVLVPENIHDYDAIIDFCNRNKLYLSMTYYMFPAYRKGIENSINENRLNPINAAKIAFKYKCDQLQTPENILSYLRKISEHLNEPSTYKFWGDNKPTCKAGLSAFWIDWKGNLSICGIANQNPMSLKEFSFKESWINAKQYHDQISISKKCTYCNKRIVCPVCVAAAFCETQKMDGTPEYCCEFSNVYIELAMKKLKEMEENNGNYLL